MFFKKQYKQQLNEMTDALKAILPAEAVLLSFSYHAKCFGNIIAEIEFNGNKHVFITDRGEICHNGKMICDSTYQEDTFQKLLIVINNIL